MKKIRLGKTNLMVTELGLGGIPLARVSKDKAVSVVKRALDLGINFIDTANAYKDSEEKIGHAINTRRDEVIIATKSTRRKGTELLNHIDNSLKLLQTDRIDLFQIHQVSSDEEIEKVFAEDGAYQATLEAKEAGKILHIGVTSHRLESAIKLVKTQKFETVQFPANFVETESLEQLFPLAIEQDMGCIVMKPLGGGYLDDVKLCFRFLQQYPQYVPIPGVSEIEEIEEIVALYEDKKPLTQEDIKELEILKEDIGTSFCRRCSYCEPCPQDVKVFAAMAIPRIIKNYGTEYRAAWFVEGAESIDRCIECGRCEELCPYNLPIRASLKEHKKQYEEIIKGNS